MHMCVIRLWSSISTIYTRLLQYSEMSQLTCVSNYNNLIILLWFEAKTHLLPAQLPHQHAHPINLPLLAQLYLDKTVLDTFIPLKRRVAEYTATPAALSSHNAGKLWSLLSCAKRWHVTSNLYVARELDVSRRTTSCAVINLLGFLQVQTYNGNGQHIK